MPLYRTLPIIEFMKVEINVRTIKFTKDHIHNVNIDNESKLRLKKARNLVINSQIIVSTHFECKTKYIILFP